jgi:hypothetical protein
MTADVDFSFFRHLCLSTKASRWNWNISRKIMLLQVAWNFLLCNTNLKATHIQMSQYDFPVFLAWGNYLLLSSFLHANTGWS